MAVPQKVLGSKLSYQEVNDMLKLYPSATKPTEGLYDGQLWLNTAGTPPVLNRYSSTQEDFEEVGSISAENLMTVLKANDGPGSGLDSDTVDGIQGSSLLRGDVDCTFTSTLTSAGAGVAMRFDNGHTIFTVHDGSGNFNIKAGIDENHNVVNTDGGAHLQFDEAGGIMLAVSSQTVGSYFDSDSHIKVRTNGIWLKGNITVETQLILPLSQPAATVDGSIWIG